MSEKKPCCIILAAGLSSRMGSFKPLLPMDNKPAILYLIEKLADAGVDTFVIITGHNAELIKDACKDEAFKTSTDLIWGHNPDYASTGMLESAKIGFSLIPKDAERILLTPADIPLVKTETIKKLISSDEMLIYPSYHYKKGHPVSFSRKLIEKLSLYSGEGGLNGAFSSLEVKPAYLITDDRFILMDMDTIDDYKKVLSHLDESKKEQEAK